MERSVSKISVLQRDLSVHNVDRVKIWAAGPENGTVNIQKPEATARFSVPKHGHVQIWACGHIVGPAIFQTSSLARIQASSKLVRKLRDA